MTEVSVGRPLKVALVSPYDHAFKGGVTDHINSLAAEFRLSGHTVRVIAPCSAPDIVDDEDFIHMGRPVPVPSGGSIARVTFSVWLRPRIKELLKRERFDVIHLHEPFAGLLTSNFLSLAQADNIPTVGTFHTYGGTRLYKVGFRSLAKPYFRKLSGRIAVSEPARQFISRNFPGDYEIIPNGVQVDEFADAEPFRHLKDGKVNLLFVGRLEKRKGLKYLLSAYARLKWDWPELRLLVVGAGEPDVDSSRIMSERNLKDVVFLGKVSDKDKARYYKTADIFCSPATGRESFGIVLLEAMSAGASVVASSIAGYSSVITDGREGLLVPPKDELALANAIERLIKEPALRHRLQATAREAVEEYRWDRVAARVMDYYGTLLHSEQLVLSS
ncbi:MAG: glycosyltransferase family 4 protein [Chloroflexi bacterium]|nr:glycosyltransferase family 4 protein [Chloroflexota bacterium]